MVAKVLKLVYLILISSSGGHQVNQDVYSSVDSVRALLLYERQVIVKLKEIQEQNKSDSNSEQQRLIQRYLSEFNNLPYIDIDLLIRDPIVCFQLLRRLALFLPLIEFKMYNRVLTPDDNLLLPTSYDVIGAAKNLVQLQCFYQIKIEDFANGKLRSIQSYSKLTGEDCHILSLVADLALYGKTRNAWRKAAQNRFINKTESLLLHKQMPSLRAAIEKYNQSTKYRQPLDKIPEYKESKLWFTGPIREMDYFNFRKLCRGIQILPPSNEYTCTLSHRDDPYYFLMPVKVETVSYNPPIYIFYDIMSNKEIEQMLNLTRPEIKRSLVLSQALGSRVIDDTVRISKHVWVPATVSPLAAKMANIVGWLTKAVCDRDEVDCQMLQVINYGIGGEYSVHWDDTVIDSPWTRSSLLKDRNSPGKRMATFVFYLSDVELGGHTAFTRAGVSVKPTKGAAVFWYNLFPNLSLDVSTVHGGCPVLYGSKWIANKWIYEKSQMFARPCPLRRK